MHSIPTTSYTHRFLARIILQAETALAIGSGESSIVTDALVIRDVNELPYIPATALAGVLRHAIDKQTGNLFFGYQDQLQPELNKGSLLIFSEARLVGANGKVMDGLQDINSICQTNEDHKFYNAFKKLPIRQHVRINSLGIAEDTGKFDEEIVYKGTRFCFELEFVGTTDQIKILKNNILPYLASSSFRLGSKTRSGLGEVSIAEYKSKELDLAVKNELESYLSKSSSLNDDAFWSSISKEKITYKDHQWTTYKLSLKPDDFFLFSSGFADNETDITPVREDIVVYSDGKGQIRENYILVPGSSIKGALAHRIAFYYNKQTGVFCDITEGNLHKNYTGKNNFAVKSLFGNEANSKNQKSNEDSSNIGNVIFSDLFFAPDKCNEYVLNHVAIDRFTGGAMDGALFSEKNLFSNDISFECSILVKKACLNEEIKKSLESALNDICIGMLPLGGGVNRGNGCFSGKYEIIKPI